MKRAKQVLTFMQLAVKLFPRYVIVLLLSACTSRPLPLTDNDTSYTWADHEKRLKNITRYQAQGALAYITEEKKVYARFHWEQMSPDAYRLKLMNPLGYTEWQLDVQGQHARLADKHGVSDASDNVDELLFKLVGMKIPLSDLRQWIIGLPGDTQDYQLDTHHRLLELTRLVSGQTWKVDFKEYHNDMDPTLPARIELETGLQKIKLRIDRWML